MNRDKGPFRAAVSGLKSTRGRALAMAQAFDSGLNPSCLHNAGGAACRGFTSEGRLSLKKEHLGWERACRLVPLQDTPGK